MPRSLSSSPLGTSNIMFVILTEASNASAVERSRTASRQRSRYRFRVACRSGREKGIFDALDSLDDIEINVFLAANPKPGLLHVSHRIAIEIGTEASGEWCHQVEKHADRANPAPHMLENIKIWPDGFNTLYSSRRATTGLGTEQKVQTVKMVSKVLSRNSSWHASIWRRSMRP